MPRPLSQTVQRQELLAHLKALEGERHPLTSPDRLEAAFAYVADQWRSWGLAVSRDEFSYAGKIFANLIARPGSVPQGPRFIVGAHVDTVSGTPGADDNASGVAALLEVSRLFASSARPIALEFAAFTLEEAGMLGSRHYAQRLCREGADVRGMLSLEMVGFTETQGLQHYPWFLRGRFPAQGTYLGIVGNHPSRRLLQAVAEAMRSVPGLPVETIALPGSGMLLPEARLSDHSPFWDAGFPALLVTDTAFFRNPHYHAATDTVDTLDVSFLERVTQSIVAVAERLA